MWVRTPDQPLIAVSTVDQVGSRLLFRGYGVTDSMKPVHAALFGCDALYLLDEVHLSQPFLETLTAIGNRYRTWAERPVLSPFVVVEMSATPGTPKASTFRLDDIDRVDPTLSRRLLASKPVSLASVSARGFLKEMETRVLSMIDIPGATIAAVVNRVKSARDLHARLSQEKRLDGRVHLLTGRMRPFDRDAIEKAILNRIAAGRIRNPEDQPVVVVATQSIEAGADFDFDGLVTECASLDALRQRFGRLDRLGELNGAARGAIVVRTDSLKDDPVYGDAIGLTWEWLCPQADANGLDFGTERLSVPDDAAERGLLTPKAHAPILLPSHLDAWVQTNPMPAPDPDVALWLHGPKRGTADVQIVWRADLTADLLDRALEPEDPDAEEIAIGMVDAIPPVSAEAMSVPFLAAKRWLEGRAEPESSDVEGAEVVSEDDLDREFVSAPRSAILWQGEQSSVIRATGLRPGQTVVVPASYGGIAHGNWAPASPESVDDLAERATISYRRRPVLRIHPAIVGEWLGTGVRALAPASQDSEAVDDLDAVRSWLEAMNLAGAARGFAEIFRQLLEDGRSLRVERLPLAPGDDGGEYFLVTGRRRRPQSDGEQHDGEVASSDDPRSSFSGAEVTLADHLAGVADMTRGFAERLGLGAGLIADLGLAAHWHDAGKADPRFQRWLHGGSEFKALVQREPLAKSRTRLSGRQAMRRARERAGYPAGGRHELTSIALMESASEALTRHADDWSFVQHAVATHHGNCRPLAPWVPDPNPVDVVFSRDGITCSASSAHELARLDSGVAERFWEMVRSYGWWGLALLEALLRLADHRQSEREQNAKGTHNA
jgi:CRISPR-associated endonuclease/helicase Cas3